MKFQRLSFSLLLQLKSGTKRDIGRLFHLLSVEEESVRFIMKGRHLRLHMCKILEFCFLPKGFVGMRPRSLYCMRAARSARTL